MFPWTTGLNSELFHRIVSLDALYQNCTNGSAQPNKGATRALDKKCRLMTFPPEPLVQIQNNFTELFLILASTKIAQTISLGLIRGLPEL